ncbi:MAG TPA: efflux transporter outer membrane subunit [Burkholderiales bacterium]|nr:efflux transporter outer membrane subunit [Burkholderiales bacterium]
MSRRFHIRPFTAGTERVRAYVAAGMLAIAAGVSGCADMNGLSSHVTPDDADHLASTRTLSRPAVDVHWPKSDWWKRLGDPQLDQLEHEAIAGSPSLQAAQARLAKARAAAGVARSTLLPRVNGGLTSTRQRFSAHDTVPPPFAGSWETENRLAFDFGYEFDLWGKNHAALAAALSRAEAARVDAFAARLLLSVAVARAYVQLAHFYDRLDVAQATLKQRQRIHELTRQRVAAGIDTRVELKQSEAALPATRENIAALDESIARTRNQLAALLGQGPDRGLAITRPRLPAENVAATLPSRLPADLLGRRPDVVASRWQVEAAARSIDVVKAQFYPNVNLLAFVGFQSIGLSQFLEAGSRIAGVGPALRLPIFEGGRLRSELAGANADYDAAVARYNRTLVDALRDISDRLAAFRSVATQRTEQRDAYAAVHEAYDLALQRYREGVGNYLSVLSAEAQVLQQQRLAADLRARAYDNRIDLVRALGGGFEPAAAVRNSESSSAGKQS